jgi:hypothetical protein
MEEVGANRNPRADWVSHSVCLFDAKLARASNLMFARCNNMAWASHPVGKTLVGILEAQHQDQIGTKFAGHDADGDAPGIRDGASLGPCAGLGGCPLPGRLRTALPAGRAALACLDGRWDAHGLIDP